MAAAAHMDVVYRFMDATTKLPLAQRLLLFVLPLLLLLHVASRSRRKQAKPLPPSPPGLPVVGHLLQVSARPHVSLRDLAARHGGGGGGLMLLRLGTVPSLVVSSPRAARAVLRTHDHVFASRPPSRLVDDLVYGSSSVGFAPYGEHWRLARMLVTAHLLTAKKVLSYHAARQEEVRLVVAKLRVAVAAGSGVDIGGAVNAFANDIICRAVCGKFFREEGRNRLFRELNHMTTVLVAGFNLEDYFPGLASLLGIFTRFTSNKEIISDHERRRIITEHGRGGASGGDDDDEQEESDFIDVMLSVQQEYGITRDHIKAILMDMFEAGTGTSSLVLEFAMVELMRNPRLMAKLQAEVRKNTPKGQEMVKEENLSSMVYLSAVVKETLRDPKSWEKAEEFMPERFMDGGSSADIDFKGKDFQFTPFGSGRRMCPGSNFGLATINIMLANLMYCFDWMLPEGMEEDIDMTEVFGLTVHRKEKLILVPKPYDTFAHPVQPEAGSMKA
ncbi:indole-2-monooxygenase-like [Panicum miliaceum]|uniref:Indole-2-monooxygenase-like n=1 Tax=Panicum miliaceum TaxID=4540 RepID=A0A3L6PJI9_PANMI|nr:indole-2-monooxygenase-like [Panicum miliaceum]